MSDQNEEITLAHDEYISANNINVDELPVDLDADLEKVNALIDIYEADPTDANFDATESASKSLKDKIQKWFESKNSAPQTPKLEVKDEQPEAKPVAAAAEQKPAQQQAPAPETKTDEEDGGWSYTQFLK